MIVRPAVPDDVTGITEVYLDSWRAGYAGLLPPHVIEEQAHRRAEYDWRAAIAAPAGTAVALEHDQIVGVVQATGPSGADRDLPEITMLYVAPSCWGSAAARRLLATGVSWMTGHGYRAARLRVVEAQARARRFYQREGWRVDNSMPPAHNGFYPLVYYWRQL